MRSPQTLSEAERRVVSVWAADCAERVLGLFEAEAPGDSRLRQAITGLRAFARGELRVWPAHTLAGHAHAAAREINTKPAAVAAARAAGQAAATAHMGAHALGAAAYAAKAARPRANPDRPNAVVDEIDWQIGHLPPPAWLALRSERSSPSCRTAWPQRLIESSQEIFQCASTVRRLEAVNQRSPPRRASRMTRVGTASERYLQDA